MNIIHINTSNPYTLYIHDHLLSTNLIANCCKELNKRCVIITDNHLVNSYGKQLQQTLQHDQIDADLLAFPAGELYKTRETKALLEDQLLEKHYTRDTCLIALGGGIVTDLVGFLASTYCRGIPVIYVPTTLLAMVDASIGGKTGVNTPLGKNMIGSFYQPQAVIMDSALLTTLPKAEWINGIVEIIKHSLIADHVFFEELAAHADQIDQPNFIKTIIYKSGLIKKAIIEQDETDQSIRQLLNFGHTIGHAIEQVEQFAIRHGEAVAIGIIVESYLATCLGILDTDSLNRIIDIFKRYHLPLTTMAFQHKSLLYDALRIDKKTINHIPRFILLKHIGQPFQQHDSYSIKIDSALLDHALDWAAQQFSTSVIPC